MENKFTIRKSLLEDVRKLVDIHIKRFKNLPQFGNPSIHTIWPLSDPMGNKDHFYEIKLTSEKNPDNGYVIVSLSKDFPPILKFAVHGLSHMEMLRESVGHWHFNAVLFTPFYIVAEDDDGNRLCEIGRPPVIFNKKPQRMKKTNNYSEFKKRFMKYRIIALKRAKEDIDKSWKLVTSSSSSGFIDESNIPLHSYQILTANHCTSLPRYIQIPPNTGANTKDYYSGCVATAWMCLFGYYDNTYTPDIFRGTHMGHMQYEHNFTSYADHMLIGLSKHLGTFESMFVDGPDGSVYNWNIDRGYSFINSPYIWHRSHQNVEVDYTESGGMQALQIVYDYLGYGAPSVIIIDGHALVAYEVWANNDNVSEAHFLKVYDGWRGRGAYYINNQITTSSDRDYQGDPFIPFEMLKGAYSLKKIEIAQHRCYSSRVDIGYFLVNYDISTPPAIADFNNKLVVVCRSNNGSICGITSTDGRNWDTSTGPHFTISTSGSGSPSVVVEPSGKYMYIAWKTEDGQLKLAEMSVDMRITELKAPQNEAVIVKHNPAITLAKEKLYYHWGNNIAYTSLDKLKRSGNPWPDFGITSEESGWNSLGSWRSIIQPTLATDGEILYLGYRDDTRHPRNDERVMLLDLYGNIIRSGFNESVGAGAKLHYFNQTMYASDRYGTIYHLDHITDSLHDINGNIYIAHLLKPKQILWPDGVKKQPILGSFKGIDIGPCLLLSWIEDHLSPPYINIQYMSEDRPKTPLDYNGWPKF